ncbi:MAG: hypothetical protein V2A73_17075, partial [Pseudomonadota bacterium]
YDQSTAISPMSSVGSRQPGSRSLAIVLALSVAACTDSGEATPDAGESDARIDAAAGDPSVLVGSFQVVLVPPDTASATPGYTRVVGKVYDGPTPAQLVWEESRTAGECRLLEPRVPFCSKPCENGSVCVEDGKCQAYPASQVVGTVKVTGIRTEAGATEFSMEPIANSYQPPAGTSLPYPAFAENDTIRFEASGSSFTAPFTLQANGIGPLELANDTIPLEQGKAVMLSWSPPGEGVASQIQVKLDISHHGGTKGMIQCEATDDGSLELAATLVTDLLNLGVAGFPTIVISRSAVGSATIVSGRVDLVVASQIEREVEIPGLDSCDDNEDCPKGETCQPDLTCK